MKRMYELLQSLHAAKGTSNVGVQLKIEPGNVVMEYYTELKELFEAWEHCNDLDKQSRIDLKDLI
jgi:hypothetical protein